MIHKRLGGHATFTNFGVVGILGHFSVSYRPFHTRDTLQVLDFYMISAQIALEDDPFYFSLTSIISISSLSITRSGARASRKATELNNFIL